jgi:hypothetical protein
LASLRYTFEGRKLTDPGSQPSSDEFRQTGVGNIPALECSHKLYPHASVHAIYIDSGVDLLASLGGVGLDW